MGKGAGKTALKNPFKKSIFNYNIIHGSNRKPHHEFKIGRGIRKIKKNRPLNSPILQANHHRKSSKIGEYTIRLRKVEVSAKSGKREKHTTLSRNTKRGVL
jgi:hypothetical protein